MTASSYQQGGGRVIECDGDAEGEDWRQMRTGSSCGLVGGYAFIYLFEKELDAFSVWNETRVVIRKRNPERLQSN